MEWTEYYDSLDSWVKEQRRAVINCRQNAAHEINCKVASMNAFTKYNAEMNEFKEVVCSSRRNRFQENSVTREPITTVTPPLLYRRFAMPNPIKRGVAELIDLAIIGLLKAIIFLMLKRDSAYNVFRFFVMDMVSSIPGFRAISKAQILSNTEFSLIRVGVLIFMNAEIVADTVDTIDFDLLVRGDRIFGILLRELVEAIFTSRSFFDNEPGGATIGKWLMNLRVVTCEGIVMLPGVVEVFPGDNPGFMKALGRSALKQGSCMTFASLLFTILFLNHRNTYDHFAGTIVVESLPMDAQQYDGVEAGAEVRAQH